MTVYVQNTNLIPNINSAGMFIANAPFDTVVDTSLFYAVYGIRTIDEMQSSKLDLYTLIFEPAGITRDDCVDVLADCKKLGGVVITLSSRGVPNVYLLSTFLNKYPSSDGVCYEHLCLIADLGAVPPSLKGKINTTIDHIQNYIAANVGVDNVVRLGVIPTRGYVTKDQANVFENTRQNVIAGTMNDVTLLAKYQDKISTQQAYITKLEKQLIDLIPPKV